MRAPNQLVALLLTIFSVASSQAGVTLSFDVDSTTPGVQTDAVVLGSPFTVDVVLTLDSEADEVLGYGFIIDYDASELSATSFVHSLPSGFHANFGMPSIENPGEVSRVFASTFDASAGAFSPSLIGPVSVSIGSISFSPVTISGGSTEAVADIFPRFVGGIDGIFRNDTTEITDIVVIQSATVSAVPEPSAFVYVALLSGLFLMVQRQATKYS